MKESIRLDGIVFDQLSPNGDDASF